MLSISLIPFLLDTVITPDFRDGDSIVLNPMYTFHVQIDTSFKNIGSFYTQVNAALAFYLRCSPYLQQSLKCYIDKTLDMSNNHSDTILTPSSLDYTQKWFRIMFDSNGVKDYLIEDKNVADKSSLLKVYRMIGDHLNIGINLNNWRLLEFWAGDRSAIADCTAYYEISRGENFSSRNYTLTSLINSPNYKFNENEDLHITKYRMKGECVPLTNYFLGQKLWSNFTLAPELTVRTKRSVSMMLLARREFSSNSVNVFHVMNETNNTVAVVAENIKVTLKSVEM